MNLSSEDQMYYGPNFTVPATVLNPNEFPYNSTDWVPDGENLPFDFVDITAPFVGGVITANSTQTTEVFCSDYA